jgi:hypothetical protein
MKYSDYYKVIILLCIIIVVIFVILNLQNLKANTTKHSKKLTKVKHFKLRNFQVNNLIKTYSSAHKCDIINKEYKQYYHVFDGVKYPQYLYLSQDKRINYDCLNNSSPMKVILAWNKFYGMASFGYGLGKVKPFKEHHCPVTNCELTNDKGRLNESDFVIVWLTDAIDTEIPRIPHQRPARQRWVAGIIESPVHTPSYADFNGVFNFTADYQIESEFGINYESQKSFSWGLNATFSDSHDYSQGKTGFMSALISNCAAWHNKRMDYINALKRYVNVTVYGGCGIPCPNDVNDCREFIGTKYKFYFAFENCNCKDYITEKFFQMLKFDIVVVVYGGGNYSRIVRKIFYLITVFLSFLERERDRTVTVILYSMIVTDRSPFLTVHRS